MPPMVTTLRCRECAHEWTEVQTEPFVPMCPICTSAKVQAIRPDDYKALKKRVSKLETDLAALQEKVKLLLVLKKRG